MLRGTPTRKALLCAASAVAMVAFAQTGYAQDQDQEDVEDEVITTGIRASIEKSLDDKRYSGQIIDTINAEDIGKSTDQNIAEALNRISGVSTTTADGEASLISIRGASPDQTVVTLNGATLGSTGFNQGVDLSTFSADILSKVEVIKTPSADDEEGSLGGLVNLITRKPLELNKDVLTFTAQGRWNTQSADGAYSKPLSAEDYKLSGTASKKFFNDTLGFIVSAVDETNSLRRDSVEFRNWDSFRSFGALDQNGNQYRSQSYTDPAIWGIAPRQVAYGVIQGQRDRQAFDAAVQWAPLDKTSITANFNYARQQIDNRSDEHTLRFNDQSRDPNFGPAVDANGDPLLHPLTLPLAPINQAAPFEDPLDWQIVNTETRTWDRILRRFDSGDVNASRNTFDNENISGAVDFEQELFGRLKFNVGGSYQLAEQIPDQQVFANLQSARENPAYLRFFLSPDQLQPHGIDCRGGACQPITGTSFIDLGNFVEELTPAQIAAAAAAGQTGTIGQPILNRASDNVSFTGVNPDDILAKSLGFLTQTVRRVEDENKVLYGDVDFTVDKFGITDFEAGAKYTQREKFVDNQSGIVNNLNPGATVINPITGNPVLVSNALDQTPLLPFTRNIRPDKFLEGIGLGGNAISDGFVSIDPVGIFDTVAGNPDLSITVDDQETRSAKFDNLALYAKANFELMDSRLTGDFGLRWVKTEVSTTGSAGLTAFNESFGRNQRIRDLRILRSLRDSSNPVCPDVPLYPGSEVADGDAYRYGRVDGTGVDTQGTATFLDDTRLPDVGACFEPLLADVNSFRADPFSPLLRRYNNTFWTNNDFFVFDDDPSNGEGYVTTDAAGLQLTSTNNTIRTFGTTGSHEYDVFLPNLNVNYIVNDDIIARFAASKTMTRPRIDSLRPGFSVRETGWGDPATRLNGLSLFNTKLDPLTSKNFDASVEWYFEEDALLSFGFFHKSIKNLEESEQQTVYLRDIKTEIQNGQDVSTDGLILDESSITVDNCYAEILGEWQYGYNPTYVENMLFSDDPTFLCAQFRASQVRNAASAEINGVELQYVQNYTFLPGIWGGLGIAANYTYQDSSFAQEVSDLAAGQVLPSFQIQRTPKHSYNITGYWQQDGHQIRVAYGGASDVLLQRAFGRGALWEDGRETLDFSAAYQFNDRITFTFDAQNILDQPIRTYFTSRNIQLPESATAGGTNLVDYDEGNAIDDGAYQGRTVLEYNTGTNIRMAVRVSF